MLNRFLTITMFFCFFIAFTISIPIYSYVKHAKNLQIAGVDFHTTNVKINSTIINQAQVSFITKEPVQYVATSSVIHTLEGRQVINEVNYINSNLIQNDHIRDNPVTMNSQRLAPLIFQFL